MAQSVVLEGEILDGGADDPDLNEAFWEFSESIKQEANASGTIAVFEVPMDAQGNPRPQTFNKPRLFTCPVGAVTLDDICDRVKREFMEPGQTMMIQLLAHRSGQRGNKMNKMFLLRRGKETGLVKADESMPGTLERMMRMMTEQRRQDMLELREILGASQRPAGDPMELGLKLAERMMTAVGAIAAGRVPGQAAPANDVNTMMTTMMTTMMIKMMEKSFDRFENPPDATPRDDSGGILKGIAEIAKPLLAAHAAERQRMAVESTRRLQHESTMSAPNPSTPAQNSPAAPAESAPSPAPSTQEQKDMKLLTVLQEVLPFVIVNGPEKKNSAAEMAGLLIANFPEDDTDLNDALYSLIQTEGDKFAARLALIDARVKDHAAWFEELRVALNAEFSPDRGSPEAGVSA